MNCGSQTLTVVGVGNLLDCGRIAKAQGVVAPWAFSHQTNIRVFAMSKHNGTLSLEQLQEVLHYDPETGIFRWKVSLGSRAKAGEIAGCIEKRRGYHKIRVANTRYASHRLAWLYMTGAWPAMDIDHINGIRSDNRFVNLRQATDSENRQNSQFSRGISVFRGVSWKANCNKWQATIMLNRKQHYLGCFDDEEKAAEAYKLARQLFHPFAPDLDSFGQCSGQEQMTAR